jgi:hypothetical protein
MLDFVQPSGPEGGAFAGDGRHGSTISKPGRVRSRNDMRAYQEQSIKESSLLTFPSASRIRSRRPNSQHAHSPGPNSRARSYSTRTPPLALSRLEGSR